MLGQCAFAGPDLDDNVAAFRTRRLGDLFKDRRGKEKMLAEALPQLNL